MGKEGDGRFFTTQKKGEMHELRMELHSTDRTVKVDAVKKTIASMTLGQLEVAPGTVFCDFGSHSFFTL